MEYLDESVTDFLMDNVTAVFLNGTHEMSKSVIISEVNDSVLVSIHHISKETGFMAIKSLVTVGRHSHFKALDSNMQ